MSTKNEKLTNHLRRELDILNLRFMDLVDQRFEVIKDIYKIKAHDSVSMWTPEREFLLFKKYIELTPKADLRFDMMYSLLIEAQASRISDYPEWSKAVHIETVQNDLTEFINPILLFVRSESKWKTLNFKEDYLLKMQKAFDV